MLCEGGVPSNYNNIDFVTIATIGNATDFGDTLGSLGIEVVLLIVMEVLNKYE